MEETLRKHTHTHAWTKEEGGNSFAKRHLLLVSRGYIFFLSPLGLLIPLLNQMTIYTKFGTQSRPTH